MSAFVKKIEATGVYGRFDIRQEFQEGINIVFGKNGAGKTTLLHILANALSGDYERFRFLVFNTINIWLSDGKILQIISKEKGNNTFIETKLDKKKLFPDSPQTEQLSLFESDEDFIRYRSEILGRDISEQEKEMILHELMKNRKRNKRDVEPIIPIAYFPAFRTMIEAWIGAATKREGIEPRRRYQVESWRDFATERARDWFGGFTPMVNFPSLVDIEEQLAGEIERARMNVWRTDQTLLSDAFQKIFSSLSELSEVGVQEESLLAVIQDLFGELEKSPLRSESKINFVRLRDQIARLNIGSNNDITALRVLKVYRDTLKSTLDVQKKSFEGIELYLSSVNEFFDEKSLVFKPDIPPHRKQSIQIQFEDGSYSNGLRTLSSGERQIMALVYAATHMSQQQIVLIDEPEISLHVDWQRNLISRMAEQMGQRQIIACTHSPVVGANHIDKMYELSLYPTSVRIPVPSENTDDEEIPF